ncbi:hypothetical protein, partial [Nocardia brasiliensis]|uniref:hypothetical protein n=1 Tax=Nocardia brasiliensis TaxID=37326 RepID=UPI0024538A46
VRPTVIDTISSYDSHGSAITLWPAGSRVLRDLGLRNSFIHTSAPLRRYAREDGVDGGLRGGLVGHGGCSLSVDGGAGTGRGRYDKSVIQGGAAPSFSLTKTKLEQT